MRKLKSLLSLSLLLSLTAKDVLAADTPAEPVHTPTPAAKPASSPNQTPAAQQDDDADTLGFKSVEVDPAELEAARKDQPQKLQQATKASTAVQKATPTPAHPGSAPALTPPGQASNKFANCILAQTLATDLTKVVGPGDAQNAAHFLFAINQLNAPVKSCHPAIATLDYRPLPSWAPLDPRLSGSINFTWEHEIQTFLPFLLSKENEEGTAWINDYFQRYSRYSIDPNYAFLISNLNVSDNFSDLNIVKAPDVTNLFITKSGRVSFSNYLVKGLGIVDERLVLKPKASLRFGIVDYQGVTNEAGYSVVLSNQSDQPVEFVESLVWYLDHLLARAQASRQATSIRQAKAQGNQDQLKLEAAPTAKFVNNAQFLRDLGLDRVKVSDAELLKAGLSQADLDAEKEYLAAKAALELKQELARQEAQVAKEQAAEQTTDKQTPAQDAKPDSSVLATALGQPKLKAQTENKVGAELHLFDPDTKVKGANQVDAYTLSPEEAVRVEVAKGEAARRTQLIRRQAVINKAVTQRYQSCQQAGQAESVCLDLAKQLNDQFLAGFLIVDTAGKVKVAEEAATSAIVAESLTKLQNFVRRNGLSTMTGEQVEQYQILENAKRLLDESNANTAKQVPAHPLASRPLTVDLPLDVLTILAQQDQKIREQLAAQVGMSPAAIAAELAKVPAEQKAEKLAEKAPANAPKAPATPEAQQAASATATQPTTKAADEHTVNKQAADKQAADKPAQAGQTNAQAATKPADKPAAVVINGQGGKIKANGSLVISSSGGITISGGSIISGGSLKIEGDKVEIDGAHIDVKKDLKIKAQDELALKKSQLKADSIAVDTQTLTDDGSLANAQTNHLSVTVGPRLEQQLALTRAYAEALAAGDKAKAAQIEQQQLALEKLALAHAEQVLGDPLDHLFQHEFYLRRQNFPTLQVGQNKQPEPATKAQAPQAQTKASELTAASKSTAASNTSSPTLSPASSPTASEPEPTVIGVTGAQDLTAEADEVSLAKPSISTFTYPTIVGFNKYLQEIIALKSTQADYNHAIFPLYLLAYYQGDDLALASQANFMRFAESYLDTLPAGYLSNLGRTRFLDMQQRFYKQLHLVKNNFRKAN